MITVLLVVGLGLTLAVVPPFLIVAGAITYLSWAWRGQALGQCREPLLAAVAVGVWRSFPWPYRLWVRFSYNRGEPAGFFYYHPLAHLGHVTVEGSQVVLARYMVRPVPYCQVGLEDPDAFRQVRDRLLQPQWPAHG